MSGIFKSVKKALKKVGKVIKKIAPILIIAAAVYFGGAYLMASAGTTGAAAGASVTYGAGGAGATVGQSVGAAFTKSGGVWKSFLSGLSNGTASQSAVAYAEASYATMNTGASLSAQVVAGTSAVEALGIYGNVAEAIPAGGKAAELFTNAKISGATTEAAQQAALESVGSQTSVTTLEASLPTASPTDMGTTVDPASSLQKAASPTEQGVTLADQSGLIADDNYTATTTKGVAQSVVAKPGVAQTGLPEMPTVGEEHYWQKVSVYNNAASQVSLQRNHDALMKVYENQAQKSMWGLGVQAVGMLGTMYGQYSQGKAVEEERERILNWKPTGREVDPADTSKLRYPDGIIS
jgi:hypothetical protein